MGVLGEPLAGRDVAIGIVLSLSLGLGLLFLHFYTAYATQVTALLFGNVLGVDSRPSGRCCCSASSAWRRWPLIARPLLFATLQPELAEAKGVSLRSSRCLSGHRRPHRGRMHPDRRRLLVFTLMVGPAAAAGNDPPPSRRRRARRGPGARRGLGRAHARLLHRLADQLLDHRPLGLLLFGSVSGEAIRALNRVGLREDVHVEEGSE